MIATRCCRVCGTEFYIKDRIGKPGSTLDCEDCAYESAVKYTGNMVYDHKAGCSIQINSDPGLTDYIRKATALRNKGSNLRNNLMVSYSTKGENRCILTVENSNAKGRMT